MEITVYPKDVKISVLVHEGLRTGLLVRFVPCTAPAKDLFGYILNEVIMNLTHIDNYLLCKFLLKVLLFLLFELFLLFNFFPELVLLLVLVYTTLYLTERLLLLDEFLFRTILRLA